MQWAGHGENKKFEQNFGLKTLRTLAV